MSTYEVENVFYNNYGGVTTKSCDLFSSKRKAISHMNRLAKQKYGLKKQGTAKDGTLVFKDEQGKIKDRIIFCQL